jgi:nucleotide-binding universal stress UspA family protein
MLVATKEVSMYKTVVWATDGSEGADAALAEALRLSALTNARLVAVHCDQRLTGRAAAWPLYPDEDDRRRRIHEQVARLREDGTDVGLVIRTSHRQAAGAVAAVAEELGADLIVCGTRGLGAVSGALGSFTQRLLHVAPCPVLAVGPHGRRAPGRTTKARTPAAVA